MKKMYIFAGYNLNDLINPNFYQENSFAVIECAPIKKNKVSFFLSSDRLFASVDGSIFVHVFLLYMYYDGTSRISHISRLIKLKIFNLIF